MILEPRIPNYIKNADNIYRTKNFIVFQEIVVDAIDDEVLATLSFDTYLTRTPERDKAFEKVYHSRANLEGKRFPATMHTRTYIE